MKLLTSYALQKNFNEKEMHHKAKDISLSANYFQCVPTLKSLVCCASANVHPLSVLPGVPLLGTSAWNFTGELNASASAFRFACHYKGNAAWTVVDLAYWCAVICF